MTAPLQHRIGAIVRRMRYGEANVVVYGDSIWAQTSTPRCHEGVRNVWRPVAWKGWAGPVIPSGADIITIVYATGSGKTVTSRAPGDTFYSGASAVCPIQAGDATWTSNLGAFGTIAEGSISAANLAAFMGGDWAEGRTCTSRFVYWGSATTTSNVGSNEYRNNVSVGFVATVALTQSGGYQNFDRTIDTTTGWPLERVWGASPNIDETGSDLALLLFRLWVPSRTGMQFCAISNGGWTAADHTDTAKCSDANHQAFLSAIGTPNVVIIQIGQNLTAGESSAIATTWKTNVEAMVNRVRTALSNLGETDPLFLLVSQYDTNKGETTHEAMNQALYELARDTSDVAFLNLHRIAGPFARLDNLYLSDSIHPNAAGANHFARKIWEGAGTTARRRIRVA